MTTTPDYTSVVGCQTCCHSNNNTTNSKVEAGELRSTTKCKTNSNTNNNECTRQNGHTIKPSQPLLNNNNNNHSHIKKKKKKRKSTRYHDEIRISRAVIDEITSYLSPVRVTYQKSFMALYSIMFLLESTSETVAWDLVRISAFVIFTFSVHHFYGTYFSRIHRSSCTDHNCCPNSNNNSNNNNDNNDCNNKNNMNSNNNSNNSEYLSKTRTNENNSEHMEHSNSNSSSSCSKFLYSKNKNKNRRVGDGSDDEGRFTQMEWIRSAFVSLIMIVWFLLVGDRVPVHLSFIPSIIPLTVFLEISGQRSHLRTIATITLNILVLCSLMVWRNGGIPNLSHHIHYSWIGYVLGTVLLSYSNMFFVISVMKFMKKLTTVEQHTALLQSKKLYKKLYRDSPSLFLSIDCEGHIINCNKSVIRLTGKSKRQLLQCKWHSLFTHESNVDLEKVERNFGSKELERSNLELWMPSVDGTVHFMTGSSIYTMNPKKPLDKQLVLNMVLHDITCQKLLNQELERAKEKAEQASNAKTTFLNVTSHEMRTPLTSIIAHCELLLKEFMDEKRLDLVQGIKSSSDILLALINDILDIARAESGNFELDCSDFNLMNCLNSIQKVMCSLVKTKDLSYSWIVRSQLPRVPLFGDPTRLTQVCINLLNNAIKFTSKGSVEMLVTSDVNDVSDNLRHQIEERERETPVPHDKIRLLFLVKDTGPGIEKKDFGKLFSPFSQLASNQKYQTGTGLGLSISKKIVELMGGSFYLESEVGKGSTFCFSALFSRGSREVPLAIETEQRFTEIDDGSSSSSCEKMSDDLSKLTVLIVDDNRITRQVMKKILVSYGVQNSNVLVAENGYEGFQVLRNHREPIHLVFMDVEMPVMDGLEATNKIREINTSVPIIILTANSSPRSRLQALGAGATNFLTKPFHVKDIAEILNEHGSVS